MQVPACLANRMTRIMVASAAGMHIGCDDLGGIRQCLPTGVNGRQEVEITRRMNPRQARLQPFTVDATRGGQRKPDLGQALRQQFGAHRSFRGRRRTPSQQEVLRRVTFLVRMIEKPHAQRPCSAPQSSSEGIQVERNGKAASSSTTPMKAQ
ncbi:hypothetical protein A8U91_00372 [Halomonas elongata]|uniref:Uncharacterized protein n=1 Tax=Halomonas elongata TaxID=2746 RepID=A0A1B8P189_HALEL|nr:hypothetical protein A8U91_00372 [Halomonas elongata]